jgi:hypothetical protein
LTLFLDATLENVLPSSADHHRPPPGTRTI